MSSLGLPKMATNLLSWSTKSLPRKMTVFPSISAKMQPRLQISMALV